MPDDSGRKKRPGQSVRIKARTRYAEGETDLTALAKALGTTRVTLWRWMKADEKAGHAWVSRKDIRNAVVTDVTQRIADKVAAEEGAKVAEELLAIGAASKLAAEYTKKILQDAMDGTIEPGDKQSKADVYSTLMMGFSRFSSTTREDHGIKPGQPTLAPESNEDRGKKYIVAIEPVDAQAS